jgi:peptidoglycan hydrolase-like protein with peptidoglycan-binding domain
MLRRTLLASGFTLLLALGVIGSASANAAGTAEPTGASAAVVAAGVCNYSGAHPTLSVGSRGAAVVHAQCLLRNIWNQDIVVDGVFGPQTRSAVLNVQTWCRALGSNIAVDGVIGPVTWGVLHTGNCP